MNAYLRLMRVDRPIGSFLLLWPSIIALFFAANGFPSLRVLIIFIIGVFIMRACGCIINDFVDKDIDCNVYRTKKRPLATGEIKSKNALILFVILACISFGLVLMLNSLVVKLSYVGMVLTIIYPFSKRYVAAPQMVLGVVWSWSIPMAFAAEANALPIKLWWLFAANWCWTVAYDTMYAMADKEDDLKIGVKSTAILFGRYNCELIGLFQVLTIICLIGTGISFNMDIIYWLGVGIFCIFCVYQQYLLTKSDRTYYIKAFLNNNLAGAILFVAVLLNYLVYF